MDILVDGDSTGFEISSIDELMAAKQLKLEVCDEADGFFGDPVMDKDEDGNEYERMPTEDERFDRAVDLLRKGERVYAVVRPPKGYVIVRETSTILQSSFCVGQKVYFLKDNKIDSAEIIKIQIVCVLNNRDEEAEYTKYEVQSVRGGHKQRPVVLTEDEIFSTIDELVEHLKENALK